MQIILLKDDTPSALDLPEDADLDMLCQMVQAELSIPINEQVLELEGVQLVRGPLSAMGVIDGSCINVKTRGGGTESRATTTAPAPAPAMGHDYVSATSCTAGQIPVPVPSTASDATADADAEYPAQRSRPLGIHDIPANVTPEELLKMVEEHPNIMYQLSNADAELAEVLKTKDVPKVRAFMMKRYMIAHQKKYTKQQELNAMWADPDNPENQKKMEEHIRMKNIQENMDAAIENLPESFGHITMLYVNIEVNGHSVKAFVDSGAQSTIMSVRCAERCGLTRLIDTRFAGMATGVGSAKIVGRVHIAQMKFGSSVFPITITVLDSNGVDFLFGLDTLRRYRCMIDLDKNALIIDGSSGREEVSFLPESECPSGIDRADSMVLGDGAISPPPPPPPGTGSGSSSSGAAADSK